MSKQVTTNSGKLQTILTLGLSYLSGLGLGVLIGTLVFPGVGSLVGMLIGGALGYYGGVVFQAYARLISTPSLSSVKTNKASGTISTVFTSSSIGGLIGTFFLPGIGTVLGSLLGALAGTGLALLGICMTYALSKINGSIEPPHNRSNLQLQETRMTLAALGVYAGIGTVLGWTLGTFLFPGVGTAMGGVIGSFLGASVGFVAESAKLLFSYDSNLWHLLAGAAGVGMAMLIPTTLGALVGTLIFPGIGTAMGAGIGAVLGAGVTSLGVLSLLPRALGGKLIKKVTPLWSRKPEVNPTETHENRFSRQDDLSFVGLSSHARVHSVLPAVKKNVKSPALTRQSTIPDKNNLKRPSRLTKNPTKLTPIAQSSLKS